MSDSDDHGAAAATAPPAASTSEEARRSLALLSVLEDLQAERGRLEREIAGRRVAEARFRATVESAPMAMVMIDADGTVVLANAETRQLFGYDAGDLIGRPIEILVPERFRADHPRQRSAYFRAPAARRMGGGRDLFGLHRDGREFPIEIGLNPLGTDEGTFVIAAIVDLTERKQAEGHLRKVNQALEISNYDLQQFAYVASHDLQTPLRAISGFARLLQRDLGGKVGERADEYIEQIMAGVLRMQQLVTDLLDYSRVEARSRQFRAVDLVDAWDGAVTMLEAPIDESRAEVTRDELPTVWGDRTQLVQVLQNLIGNAIKYHGEDPPRVHISAAREGAGWAIAVRDNGIGMKPEHHERIFEIFQRLHSQEAYPGTGIGLAICRRIVQRHGGEIRVESAEGAGSTFVFTVPDHSDEDAAADESEPAVASAPALER